MVWVGRPQVMVNQEIDVKLYVATLCLEGSTTSYGLPRNIRTKNVATQCMHGG